METKVTLSRYFSLLNIRIAFLFSAFVHLVVTAMVTLNIDTTVDEDPRVQAYYYTRWKLITCWFNLITLVYLLARSYCDWRTRQGDGNHPLVRLINHGSDVVMTSILFPVTSFSCIVFWVLYNKDPALLAPPRVFYYLPMWAQHSLHTVSTFVVLLDVVLTPRRCPSTMKPRLALMTAFATIYSLMVFNSHSNGDSVYAVLDHMGSAQFTLLFIVSLVFLIILFAIQWVIIDLIWGKDSKKTKIP